MKRAKRFALYFFTTIALFYFASKISKSNSAYVCYCDERLGGGDVLAIMKLNQLVELNFLYRDYYEGIACTNDDLGFFENCYPRWYANYNKKHQALLITGDPLSGWSYFFRATPEELRMVSEKKIPADQLHRYLKPLPLMELMDCPTRSNDLISIF
jgi:hypothetical protein